MKSEDRWKPTSADFISNPHPVYDQIRKEGSVFRAKTGDFVVLGYDECVQALSSKHVISGQQYEKMKNIVSYAKTRGEDFEAIEKMLTGMLIQMNDPIHSRIRSQIVKFWPTTDAITKVINRSINEVISTLPQSFDAIDGLCKDISLRVICGLLGFPYARAMAYSLDGLNVVQSLDPYFSYQDLVKAQSSALRLQELINNIISHQDAQLTTLARGIINIDETSANLDSKLLLSFIFIAGYETTSSLLAACLIELIKNPEHAKKIESKGSRPFVKEILRIFSPVQITGRETTSEMQLGHYKIPKKAPLTLCLGAANTDPMKFHNPLSINWDRSNYVHLSFGIGIHHCLGSQIAELEACLFVEKIIPFLTRLKLEEAPCLDKKFAVRSFQSFKISMK